MTPIHRLILAAAVGLFLAAGTTACSHGYVDVRGYDYEPVPAGYDEVDIVGVDGFHHHGYYDRDHAWHGGYYDSGRHFHADARTWHR